MINDGLRGMVELLIEEGEGKYIKEDIHGATYTNKELVRIEAPMAGHMKTTTLTSIVDYIKENVDESAAGKIIVHVESYNQVSIKKELNADKRRECLVIA